MWFTCSFCVSRTHTHNIVNHISIISFSNSNKIIISESSCGAIGRVECFWSICGFRFIQLFYFMPLPFNARHKQLWTLNIMKQQNAKRWNILCNFPSHCRRNDDEKSKWSGSTISLSSLLFQWNSWCCYVSDGIRSGSANLGLLRFIPIAEFVHFHIIVDWQ